ncbi:MAG: hypothetical protein ACREPY_01790 [Rhodanobacteraceae bacterium]
MSQRDLERAGVITAATTGRMHQRHVAEGPAEGPYKTDHYRYWSPPVCYNGNTGKRRGASLVFCFAQIATTTNTAAIMNNSLGGTVSMQFPFIASQVQARHRRQGRP